MAELVDALDSKSCSFGSAGSIPARGTKSRVKNRARAMLGTLLFFFILFLLLAPLDFTRLVTFTEFKSILQLVRQYIHFLY